MKRFFGLAYTSLTLPPSAHWRRGMTLALLVNTAIVGCNTSQFGGSAAPKAKVNSKDDGTDSGNNNNGDTTTDSSNRNGGNGGNGGDQGGDSGNDGDKSGRFGTGGDGAIKFDTTDSSNGDMRANVPLTTSRTQNAVWVVTADGNGYRILLEAANAYPMTAFKGAGANSGHRTFVSPWGLFIGTTAGSSADGGKVYFMQNVFKDGDKAEVAVDLNTQKIASGSRICVSVFTLNNVDYFGAAFTTAGNVRAFYHAPIDLTKPGLVDTAKGKVGAAGTGMGEWGYSCYTDRKRNVFWSKNNGAGGNISGIDLTSGALLKATSAPNGNFTMKGPGSLSLNLAAANQSYAMAGAVDGSLLSGVSGIYTMANEPISDSVIASTYGGNPLYLLSAKCFTSKADCSGAGLSATTTSAAYDIRAAGFIGPLSSLNDGRVLGLERGGKSSVYLMSLSDPADITKGLEITKIKEVPGDSYMYSDFTGSMSLARSITRTIDLTQAPNFKPGVPFSLAFLSWNAIAGSTNKWIGLTLSVVCYKKGSPAGTPGVISDVAVSGTEFDISSAPGCSGVFDQVKISVAPETQNTLVYSKTSALIFHGKQ